MAQFGEEILRIEELRIEAAGDNRQTAAIVDGVSLTLRRGEVLGLIGESGAGKSTIGLAALGHSRAGCRVASGRVLFKGRDIRTLPRDDLRRLRGHRIAYVAQSAAAAFNPAMTISTQVCEAPIRHDVLTRSEARERAIGLFRELDLPSPETFGERYPHEVSGGQLQRAMAAMAVAARPDIVVFDEPTTALDVTTQVEVLAAFRRLIKEHGTAALYITHDLAVVAQIADRIMVLRHGRMVEEGPAATILTCPREEYTCRLVAERSATQQAAASPGASEPPLLSVADVSAGYGDVTVVDRVSLELRPGDTLAVVGESGSGKSSLARLITGLLPSRSGDLRFRGANLPPRLEARNRDQLRRIQMIYQMPDVALNPRQRVGEILGRPIEFYFKRARGAVKGRVDELLRAIDLPESYAKRFPGELSGGQKQRVCIARALAAEPDVIICDEVTSALDQLVGEGILKLLKRLQEELGIAYLFISHDLGTVQRVANKVAVMLNGRIVASGETSAVFSPPRDPYTELLLSSVPELRTDWLDGVLAKRTRPGETSLAAPALVRTGLG
jgi:peptide/nickel transport system ATP-binding protein